MGFLVGVSSPVCNHVGRSAAFSGVQRRSAAFSGVQRRSAAFSGVESSKKGAERPCLPTSEKANTYF
jgi:hypothetical protein